MEERLVFHERVRLSFGSFIILMAIAGFSIALISVIFQTLSSFWRLFAGDPSITIGEVAKPFLSMLIDPLDAVISGIVIFPIYRLIMRKYANLGLKLFIIK